MKVLVAMNQELLRYGLVQLLKDIKPIDYIAEVSTVEELINTAKTYKFDLIVADANLQGGDYITTLLTRLKGLPSDCKRVFLWKECNNQVSSLEKADGVFHENSSLEELMDFFQRVLEGEKLYLNVNKQNSSVDNYNNNELSRREKEVFQLKVNGYTVKDTAKLLSISPKTVENHRRNIRKKLNILRNSEWVEWGKRLGML
ncbi:MAG: response regulator transcription factor [Bacillus sp. (in: Bacteria)]|nr:response regulator transcription factor [Bacillus sp. (in: firmicutes)]